MTRVPLQPFCNAVPRAVGEYRWRPLSQWEVIPKKCVIMTSEPFLWILERVKSMASDGSMRMEQVTLLDGVPHDVLAWRDGVVEVRR